MNFFRDKELAERFAADNVSEREKFHYFLITLILVEVLTTTYLLKITEDKVYFWDYILDVVAIVSTLIGTIWIYYLNTLGDGQNFIARFMSLSVPVFIKSCAIALVFGIVLAITEIVREDMYKLKPFSEEFISLYFFGAVILAYFYYYLRLAYVMKIASRPVNHWRS